MKRSLLALLAGAVLVGATAPMAMAWQIDAPGPVEHATLAEVVELLGDVQATMAGAEAVLTRSKETTESLRWRRQECRFQSLQRGTWTDREERATTRCAVGKWLPGQLSKVFMVMACESGMYRFARNGPYVGLFQHVESEFDDRVRAFEPRTWDSHLSRRWANSRSQIVMSVRMASAVGWSPWGCA